MAKALRKVARLIEGLGWNRFGFILSIGIICVAAVVLYEILHEVKLEELFNALRAVDPHSVAFAAIFVACAYFTLTFYDLFALRTIGRRDVPYRFAALAAFTSYSIGHNVGASVFTGGAVRYRIYSSCGLSAIEVAKICFVAGLTFWLGNAAVLGLGILAVPEAASAVDQLPPWMNRLLAIGILSALVAYVAWVSLRARQIGLKDWQVTLPGGGLTILQIGIGIVDLAFCSFAMYVLLPSEPHINFIMLAVIFVAATLLGFASHSPGGLGVFDAAMLIGLWQFDREELLAGLLLFRLVYYVIPLALALLTLGIREFMLTLPAKGDTQNSSSSAKKIGESPAK